MATAIGLQERIAEMMLRGTSLDRVEEEVINNNRDLNSEQKAALWLYAWSFVDGKSQRETATSYLLQSEAS